MIVITGATGKLGRLVTDLLLQKVPPEQIAVAVRDPQKAQELEEKGVDIRQADYNKPETLPKAMAGADKVLLVSSSEVGRRTVQHQAVIDAVKREGVKLLVYTSLLRADTSGLRLAIEHKATEQAIREGGVPFTFLRNGWYIENYTENFAPAIENGTLIGTAGEGRIAAATRADFAAAAVAVLTERGHENKIYELCGDTPFTMSELAAEVSRHAGKTIGYTNVQSDQYKQILIGAGLPEPFAELLVDADEGIARGELDGLSNDLNRLIGRQTTPLAKAVAEAFKQK